MLTPLDCCETEPKTLDEGIFEEEEEEKVTADAMKFFFHVPLGRLIVRHEFFSFSKYSGLAFGS